MFLFLKSMLSKTMVRDPKWFRTIVFFGILVILAGCIGPTSTDSPPIQTPTPDTVLTPTPVADPIETPDPSETGPLTLRVWLPPSFATPGTTSGDLMMERIHSFNTLYPGVRVEIRIKNPAGPGGMLDALAATEGVSLNGLPDLVLLSRTTLEDVVDEGLAYPFDPLLDAESDTDWYDFALEIGSVRGEMYGLPIAGDGLVLAYDAETITSPPRDWSTTISSGQPILFAAGSNRALYSLALYRAAGGIIQNSDGSAIIEPPVLTAVFNHIAEGLAANVYPSENIDIDTEAEAWTTLRNGIAPMAITWASNVLENPLPDTAAALIPTVGSIPFSLIDGWAWALTTPNPDRHPLAVALAQHMTAADFLAVWTAEAGYLPARPSSLAFWPDGESKEMANLIISSAEVIPIKPVLNALGPAIQQATLNLWGQVITPQGAADAVRLRVSGP